MVDNSSTECSWPEQGVWKRSCFRESEKEDLPCGRGFHVAQGLQHLGSRQGTSVLKVRALWDVVVSWYLMLAPSNTADWVPKDELFPPACKKGMSHT